MNTSFISKLALGALNMPGLTVAGLDSALGGSIYGKPFAVKEGTEEALRKPIKDTTNLSVESNVNNPIESKEVDLSHDMTSVSGAPIPSSTFPPSNEGQYNINIPVLEKPQDPMFVQPTFEEPKVKEVDTFVQLPTHEQIIESSSMHRQADSDIRTDDFDRKVLGAKENCIANIAAAIDGLVDDLENINNQQIESTVAKVSGEIDAANTQIQAVMDNTLVAPSNMQTTPEPFNQIPQQPTL